MSRGFLLFRVRLHMENGTIGYCTSDREARLFVRGHLREKLLWKQHGGSIVVEDDDGNLVDVDTGKIVSDLSLLSP